MPACWNRLRLDELRTESSCGLSARLSASERRGVARWTAWREGPLSGPRERSTPAFGGPLVPGLDCNGPARASATDLYDELHVDLLLILEMKEVIEH